MKLAGLYMYSLLSEWKREHTIKDDLSRNNESSLSDQGSWSYIKRA